MKRYLPLQYYTCMEVHAKKAKESKSAVSCTCWQNKHNFALQKLQSELSDACDKNAIWCLWNFRFFLFIFSIFKCFMYVMLCMRRSSNKCVYSESQTKTQNSSHCYSHTLDLSFFVLFNNILFHKCLLLICWPS